MVFHSKNGSFGIKNEFSLTAKDRPLHCRNTDVITSGNIPPRHLAEKMQRRNFASFQVALYKYVGTEWEKTNIEGTLFVYTRKCEPCYGFLILNRLSATNLIQPITKDIELQDKTPFLLYKTEVSDTDDRPTVNWFIFIIYYCRIFMAFGFTNKPIAKSCFKSSTTSLKS